MVTTHNEVTSGLGILADNQDLYADNQNYYCDGAIVMREPKMELQAGDTEITANTIYYDASGVVRSIDEILLLKCNEQRSSLEFSCASKKYDCSGSIYHDKCSSDSITCTDETFLLGANNEQFMANTILYDATGAVKTDKESY